MRLLHHRILCLLAAAVILTLAATSHAQTEPLNYKDMDIPIMDGATDITDEWNEDFYTRKLSYKIKIEDDKTVLKFYTKYFKGNGWQNFFDNWPKVPNHPVFSELKWGGTSYRIVPGKTKMQYGTSWTWKSPPVNAMLSLTYSDYNESINTFESLITITISPSLDIHESAENKYRDQSMDLHDLIEKNPKNIFILDKGLGHIFDEKGQMDFLKFNPQSVPTEFKDKEIIKGYIKMIEDLKASYKDFGKKYFPETTQNAQ